MKHKIEAEIQRKTGAKERNRDLEYVTDRQRQRDRQRGDHKLKRGRGAEGREVRRKSERQKIQGEGSRDQGEEVGETERKEAAREH